MLGAHPCSCLAHTWLEKQCALRPRGRAKGTRMLGAEMIRNEVGVTGVAGMSPGFMRRMDGSAGEYLRPRSGLGGRDVRCRR